MENGERLRFQCDCATMGGKQKGVFSIGEILIICLLFVVTLMLYTSNVYSTRMLEKEIDTLKNSDSEIRIYFENKIQLLIAAGNGTNSNVELHRRDKRQTQREVRNPKTPVAAYGTYYTAHQRLDLLENDLKEHKSDVARLQNDVYCLKEESHNLKCDFGTQEVNFDILWNYTVSLGQNLSDLEITAFAFQKDIQNSKNSLLKLQQEIKEIKLGSVPKPAFVKLGAESNNNNKFLLDLIDALDSQNKNVSESLKKIRNDLESIQVGLANVEENLTEAVESDCGGIISIPTTKESYLLQYKLNRSYNPNENCLWTVENTENSIRSRLTLRVELISNGFKENTGLFAYKWNRDDGLASENITSGKEHESSAEGLYLSFSSGSRAGTGGTGFLLRITIIHSELKTYGSNHFARTSPGGHTVSSYQNGDQISFAVNSKTPITFNVNNVNSEEANDILYVYEILANGKFISKPKDILSGKLKNALSFSTTHPVLAIFSSDYSTTGNGFRISWTTNNELPVEA